MNNMSKEFNNELLNYNNLEEREEHDNIDKEIEYKKVNSFNNCCICFESKPTLRTNLNKNDLSLNDIDINKVELSNDILLLSCCNEHYICVECLRRYVNNYENHPINENNSHVYCPYPFKECVNNMGFKNIFNHSDIKKIFKSKNELDNYELHSNQYIFPGYTVIKCPLEISNTKCGSEILISNEDLKTKEKGELVLICDQNVSCLRKFCFTCKKNISYYAPNCQECLVAYENESPNMYNYFFNKKKTLSDTKDDIIEKTYLESDYLYINGEITKEIALTQLLELIENVDSYMICPICKISLYKTEKCNGLSHHHIERCYACGRIGYKIKGLDVHWSYDGINGCYRFDTDIYVNKYIKNYKCIDSFCSNHEIGDCTYPDHKQGIIDMFNSRKKAYIYHSLMSLLANIRYDVYDELYDTLKTQNKNELIDLLPYKQTLKILEIKKERLKDYSEDIVYDFLQLENPKNIEDYKDKKFFINYEEYVDLYKKQNEKENINENSIFTFNIDNLIDDINNRLDELNNSIEHIRNTSNLSQELLNQSNELLNGINENNQNNVEIINNLEEDNIENEINEEFSGSVDISDLLPPPPLYLRKQLYDYEDNDIFSDDDINETTQLIPVSALSNSIINNANNGITGNSIMTRSENTQITNEYTLLDDILDLLMEDYESI